jgi:hypothetical protein
MKVKPINEWFGSAEGAIHFGWEWAVNALYHL